MPQFGFVENRKGKRIPKKSLPLKKRGIPPIVLQEQRRSPRVIARAMKAVQSGRLSYGQAEKIYGIPKSSNYQRVKGMREPGKKGRKRVLSDPEEDRLVRFIELMTRTGNPLPQEQIGIVVSDIVRKSTNPERKGFEKNGMPSKFPSSDEIS